MTILDELEKLDLKTRSMKKMARPPEINPDDVDRPLPNHTKSSLIIEDCFTLLRGNRTTYPTRILKGLE